MDILRVGERHCVSVCILHGRKTLENINAHIQQHDERIPEGKKEEYEMCAEAHVFSPFLLFILLLSLHRR